MNSILTYIKQALGVGGEEQTAFDPEIIMHINSVMLNVNQLGVGPENGFMISSKEEVWTELLGDRKDLEAVKTYIYLKVRLLFDPPSSSFVLESIKNQITEYEWRLNAQVEKVQVVEEGGITNG